MYCNSSATSVTVLQKLTAKNSQLSCKDIAFVSFLFKEVYSRLCTYMNGKSFVKNKVKNN
jgi:hypothetical protein